MVEVKGIYILVLRLVLKILNPQMKNILLNIMQAVAKLPHFNSSS